MDIQLSVLIPTFNRKEKLKNTLKSLERQYENNFYVVVLDNASDFSIETEIIPELSKDFGIAIRMIKRKFNVGLGNNIAGLFSVCDTKWGWLLGDNDIINSSAISIILKNITLHPDYAGFWYALDSSYNDRIVVSNPIALVKLKVERNLFNDSCFLSNKVYNFEYVHLYSDIVYTYAYTMISFSLVIFEVLKYNY